MDLGTLERQHSEIEEALLTINQTISNNNIDKDATKIAKEISILSGKLRVHLTTEDSSMYPYLLETGNEQVKTLAKEFADEMGHISEAFMAYKDRFNTRTKIINNQEDFFKETKQIFKVLQERMDKEDKHLYKFI